MSDIQIKGLADLQRQLRTLPRKIQNRALGAAMRAGAREVVREIKTRAPVDTGALRRNVVTKRGRRQFDAGLAQRQIIGVRHGRVRAGSKRVYDRRGVDPFYFRFQETGYTAVGRRKAGSRAERSNRKANARTYGRFVPGKRFMRQGLLAAGPRALGVIRTRLAAEIQRLT